MGYKVCCKRTSNANVLLDIDENRGRKIYGWAEVSEDPMSIDSYLSIFTLPGHEDWFKLEVYPNLPYWYNNSLTYINDLSLIEEVINNAIM